MKRLLLIILQITIVLSISAQIDPDNPTGGRPRPGYDQPIRGRNMTPPDSGMVIVTELFQGRQPVAKYEYFDSIPYFQNLVQMIGDGGGGTGDVTLVQLNDSLAQVNQRLSDSIELLRSQLTFTTTPTLLQYGSPTGSLLENAKLFYDENTLYNFSGTIPGSVSGTPSMIVGNSISGNATTRMYMIAGQNRSSRFYMGTSADAERSSIIYDNTGEYLGFGMDGREESILFSGNGFNAGIQINPDDVAWKPYALYSNTRASHTHHLYMESPTPGRDFSVSKSNSEDGGTSLGLNVGLNPNSAIHVRVAGGQEYAIEVDSQDSMSLFSIDPQGRIKGNAYASGSSFSGNGSVAVWSPDGTLLVGDNSVVSGIDSTNVLTWGATPNDGLSDQLAIDAFLNYIDTSNTKINKMFFPAGQYILDSIYANDAIWICGEGFNQPGTVGSYIEFESDVDNAINFQGNNYSSLTNLQIRATGGADTIVNFANVNRVHVSENYIRGNDTGVALYGRENLYITVSDNTIGNNYRGLVLDDQPGGGYYGTNVGWIHNNEFYSVGARIVASGTFTISNNSFEGAHNPDSAMVVLNGIAAGNITFQNNYWENTENDDGGTTRAIWVDGAVGGVNLIANTMYVQAGNPNNAVMMDGETLIANFNSTNNKMIRWDSVYMFSTTNQGDYSFLGNNYGNLDKQDYQDGKIFSPALTPNNGNILQNFGFQNLVINEPQIGVYHVEGSPITQQWVEVSNFATHSDTLDLSRTSMWIWNRTVDSDTVKFENEVFSKGAVIKIYFESDGYLQNGDFYEAGETATLSVLPDESILYETKVTQVNQGASGTGFPSPDANGDLTVLHGLGEIPNYAQVTHNGTTPYFISWHSATATEIKFRVSDSTGLPVTTGTVGISWTVKRL